MLTRLASAEYGASRVVGVATNAERTQPRSTDYCCIEERTEDEALAAMAKQFFAKPQETQSGEWDDWDAEGSS